MVRVGASEEFPKFPIREKSYESETYAISPVAPIRTIVIFNILLVHRNTVSIVVGSVSCVRTILRFVEILGIIIVEVYIVSNSHRLSKKSIFDTMRRSKVPWLAS